MQGTVVIDASTLLAWLLSEAGAGWVVGIVSLAGLVLTIAFRKRPARLEVTEADRYLLLSAPYFVRDDINISFAGKPVDSLTQSFFSITNSGSDVLRDIDITLVYPEDTKVLTVWVSPGPECVSHLIDEDTRNAVVITVDFINSYKAHSHMVFLGVLCDGPAENVSVVGGGAGWSIRTRQLPARSKDRRWPW